jgi:hypothetical protein
MLLSPSTFWREVRRCFSHFAVVALFRVWAMEPHRRTSLRSANPSRGDVLTSTGYDYVYTFEVWPEPYPKTDAAPRELRNERIAAMVALV